MPAILDTTSTPVLHYGVRSVQSFNQDGYEVARHRQVQEKGLPLGQLLKFALVVFSFKIFLCLQMGVGAYGAKIDQLSQGGFPERLAAQLMVLDPVSQMIVGEVRRNPWIALNF